MNRLLNGAGASIVLNNGKVVEGAYVRLSNPRTSGRCATVITESIPDIPEIGSEYRGVRRTNDWEWGKLSSIEAQGSRVYYNSVGNLSGKVRRFHVQFGSSSQAQAFAQAANAVNEACAGRGENGRVDEVVNDPKGKIASLAIDRRNGNRYGWAIDYESIAAADRRSIAECSRNGTPCQVVLRFTGGCGAYAADTAKGSTAYGWGTAATRAAAESRAQAEARKRGGTNVVTRVWGCNSVRSGASPVPSTATSGAQDARAERERQFQQKMREHEAAVRASDAAAQRYKQQLQANEKTLQNAAERRKAAQAKHDAELAKARAAREQYERDRQAYREEYKRVTGRYPEE